MLKKNIFLRLVLQFIQFVVAILVARYLGASENGSFSLFITEAAFLILIIGFSFESSITYFLAKQKINVSNIIGLIVSLFVFQILFFVLLYFISKWSFEHTFFNNFSKRNLFYGILFIIAFIIGNAFSAILFAFKKFEKYFIGSIFIQLALLVYILLVKHNDLQFYLDANVVIAIFTCAALLQALFSIILVYASFKHEIKNIFNNLPFTKEIFKYTLLVFLANCIQFLCYRMDVWFVDYYHTREAVGQYAFATKIAQLWWVLPQIMAALFFPLLALKEQSVESFKRSIFYLIFISIITGLVAMLLYPFIIPIVTSAEYLISYKAFVCLLPGVIFFSINILLASKFSADGNVIYNLKISIICFVIVLVFNMLLIPKYGIVGAAIASTIAYTFSSIFAIFKFVYGKKN